MCPASDLPQSQRRPGDTDGPQAASSSQTKGRQLRGEGDSWELLVKASDLGCEAHEMPRTAGTTQLAN